VIADNKYVNGKLSGICKNFYKNGSLKQSGTFKNNLLEGLNKAYYPNGQLESEANYSEGVLNGWAKFFHIDGRLIESREYKNGIPIYTPQEIEIMKVKALQDIAFQQALNSMYNNINQQTQINLLQQQNNLLRSSNSRPTSYRGTITDTGFGTYRFNLHQY
jgi:hypothetical protein